MDETLRGQLDQAHEHRVGGNYDAAKALYQEVLEGDRQCAEACFWLGYTEMMGFGEFGLGLDLMRKGAGLSPEVPRFHFELAKAYLMLGDDEAGKELLLHVVRTWPGTREAQEAEKQLTYFPDVAPGSLPGSGASAAADGECDPDGGSRVCDL